MKESKKYEVTIMYWTCDRDRVVVAQKIMSKTYRAETIKEGEQKILDFLFQLWAARKNLVVIERIAIENLVEVEQTIVFSRKQIKDFIEKAWKNVAEVNRHVISTFSPYNFSLEDVSHEVDIRDKAKKLKIGDIDVEFKPKKEGKD